MSTVKDLFEMVARRRHCPECDRLREQVRRLLKEVSKHQSALEDERAEHHKTRAARVVFPVVDSDSPPAWCETDAAAWAAFLGTDPGQRLMRLANYQEQAANRAAVLQAGIDNSAAAVAKGFHEATKYFFHTLSVRDQRKPADDAGEDATDAERLRERLAS